MSHPSRDELLALSLDLLEEGEAEVMHQHLRACGPCAEEFRQRLRENEALRAVQVTVPEPAIPLPRTTRLGDGRWWRVAAVLVVGLVGYSATELLRPPPRVLPQSLRVAVPPDSLQPHLSCDAVDLVVHN